MNISYGLKAVNVFIIISAGFFVFMPNVSAQAKDKSAMPEQAQSKELAGENEIVEVKEADGLISALGPNFIAIIYGQSKDASLEMAFNLNKNLVVEHKKSMKEIFMGDTVKVIYDEITMTNGEGKKIIRRVLKKVVFLRAAEKPKEEIAPDTSSPVEEQKELFFLPLKGLKS